MPDEHGDKYCAFYFYPCQTTRLRWYPCSGKNGELAAVAGKCVKPEYLPPDMLGGASDGGAGGEGGAGGDDMTIP